MLKNIFLIAVVYLSGCSTVLTNTSDGYAENGDRLQNVGLGSLYSGTKFNANSLYCLSKDFTETWHLFLLFGPLFIIDLPLSLAADTLMVPADLGNENQVKKLRKRDRCYFHI